MPADYRPHTGGDTSLTGNISQSRKAGSLGSRGISILGFFHLGELLLDLPSQLNPPIHLAWEDAAVDKPHQAQNDTVPPASVQM